MAHFGSTDWNNPSGLVAQLEGIAVATPTATGSGSTDDTDRLTYAVLRTGGYRIVSVCKVNVVSDAATTDVFVAQVAYNNGAAVAAANIQLSGVTALTSTDATSATATANQSSVIKANVGTDIVLTVLSTVVGAKTAGSLDMNFYIEAL